MKHRHGLNQDDIHNAQPQQLRRLAESIRRVEQQKNAERAGQDGGKHEWMTPPQPGSSAVRPRTDQGIANRVNNDARRQGQPNQAGRHAANLVVEQEQQTAGGGEHN